MLDPWPFVVVALAAYRMTRFFVFDSLIGARLESGSGWSKVVDRFAYTRTGEDRSLVRGKLGDLVQCPFCLGAWVSVATLAAWWWGNDAVRWVVTAWAVAGLAALLNVKEQDGHSYVLREFREWRARRVESHR